MAKHKKNVKVEETDNFEENFDEEIPEDVPETEEKEETEVERLRREYKAAVKKEKEEKKEMRKAKMSKKAKILIGVGAALVAAGGATVYAVTKKKDKYADSDNAEDLTDPDLSDGEEKAGSDSDDGVDIIEF